MVERPSTPRSARIFYWLLGAPAIFLGVLYAGTLPLMLVGSAEERAPATNLAVGPYGAVLFLIAFYLTWSCWRGVRGDTPSEAFRPFPWPVWAAAVALGAVSGAVVFLRAS